MPRIAASPRSLSAVVSAARASTTGAVAPLAAPAEPELAPGESAGPPCSADPSPARFPPAAPAVVPATNGSAAALLPPPSTKPGRAPPNAEAAENKTDPSAPAPTGAKTGLVSGAPPGERRVEHLDQVVAGAQSNVDALQWHPHAILGVQVGLEVGHCVLWLHQHALLLVPAGEQHVRVARLDLGPRGHGHDGARLVQLG
eukprot:scaffold1297_cov114-Isochrysis_galbana.AAC.7